jgi:hypothetical protein
MHQFGNRARRIGLQKQVDVIGHDFQCMNRGFQLSSYLSQELSQSLLYRSNEHRSSILGTPHQMKLQGEDRSSVLDVPLDHTYIIYTSATKSTTEGDGLPLPAKAGSPRPVN